MAHPSLSGLLLTSQLSPGDIAGRQLGVQQQVLASSTHLRQPDFTTVHTRDLASLFYAYDERFFHGLIHQALPREHLRFRLSTRMTRAAGKTTRFRTSSGETRYEIAISCGLLFDAFREGDRAITVCGVECATRLDAMQRIVEHEIVHLLEQVCWGASDCAAPQFQGIASRFFLHQSHQHQMITRGERAGAIGIRPGAVVTFHYEGRALSGRVNRITKRATVLVEDVAGMPYSDGRRYLTYYVPVARLRIGPVQ